MPLLTPLTLGAHSNICQLFKGNARQHSYNYYNSGTSTLFTTYSHLKLSQYCKSVCEIFPCVRLDLVQRAVERLKPRLIRKYTLWKTFCKPCGSTWTVTQPKKMPDFGTLKIEALLLLNHCTHTHVES